MKIRKRRKNKKISLRLIPISKYGYDRQGRYWGIGQPLYVAEDMETGQGTIFRASNRSEAIKKIGSELGNGYKRRY